MENKSANDEQIGGDHYKAAIQHWDFVALNGIEYLAGCATKYITRNRKKYADPREDLSKARHYVEKMIELAKLGVLKPRPYKVMTVDLFVQSNKLNKYERFLIWKIVNWHNVENLVAALDEIDRLMIPTLGMKA